MGNVVKTFSLVSLLLLILGTILNFSSMNKVVLINLVLIPPIVSLSPRNIRKMSNFVHMKAVYTGWGSLIII